MEGVKERKNTKEESNENECVHTDIQRPSRLNEIDSLFEELKAFKQTEDRGFPLRTRLNIQRQRQTDRQTDRQINRQMHPNENF